MVDRHLPISETAWLSLRLSLWAHVGDALSAFRSQITDLKDRDAPPPGPPSLDQTAAQAYSRFRVSRFFCTHSGSRRCQHTWHQGRSLHRWQHAHVRCRVC